MAGTIGLSFIFRDNASTIKRCLRPWIPFVNEIVAVDTGSKDGTRELVEEILADFAGRSEVVDFEWIGDFAAARNAGWTKLTASWSAWVDTDEYLYGADALPVVIERAAKLGVDCIDIPAFWNGTAIARCPGAIVNRAVGWNWEAPINEGLVPARPVRTILPYELAIDHRRIGEPTDSKRGKRLAAKHAGTHLFVKALHDGNAHIEWMRLLADRFVPLPCPEEAIAAVRDPRNPVVQLAAFGWFPIGTEDERRANIRATMLKQLPRDRPARPEREFIRPAFALQLIRYPERSASFPLEAWGAHVPSRPTTHPP